MRVPALRLPAWRPSFEWPEGVSVRAVLGYTLWTIILFCVFLIANFPHHLLVQRALRAVEPPGMRFDLGDARFAWWRGLELQRLRLGPADPTRAPYFEAASLYVRPGLSGLLRGELQSVDISGSAYGGRFEGTLTRGAVNRVVLNFSGLQLQRYPLLPELVSAVELGGRLSGALSVEARGSDLNDTRAAGEISVADGMLRAANTEQDPIVLDTAATRFSLQGGRLELQDLVVDGPEIAVKGGGQVVVRLPVTDSVLNLKTTIETKPEARDELKAILGALIPPPPKGQRADAPRVISGTLSKPRIR